MPTLTTAAALKRALAKERLLFAQDAKWPSVAAFVAGEVVKGSWWSHPQAQAIFKLLNELDDNDDLLFVKLVSAKVTIVDASLVAAVHAIGGAREAWQTTKLSAPAKKLLASLEKDGSKRTTGAAAKELELRLLVRARQVHTASGKHENELSLWPSSKVNVDAAKRAVEAVVDAKNAAHAAKHTLPWR